MVIFENPQHLLDRVETRSATLEVLNARSQGTLEGRTNRRLSTGVDSVASKAAGPSVNRESPARPGASVSDWLGRGRGAGNTDK